MQTYRFHKYERLKSRKQIGKLFDVKQSVGGYPLRFFWMLSLEDNPKTRLQVAFSVSKRKFKRAVDRNRLKRLIREAHRIHKQKILPLLEQNDAFVIGMWVYVAKDIVAFKEVEKGVNKVFKRLAQDPCFDSE